MVEHRAISRLVLNNGYADFNAEDRVAFASNPAFDAATLELWAPLLNGGCMVMVKESVLLEAGELGQQLRRDGVNVLWLTVGLFNQYAEVLGEELGSMRYLIVGGDALDAQVIRRVRASHPPQHLLNGYGPTETTTFAATHRIEEVEEEAWNIPIGRPVANAQIYILDERGEPVPMGVRGELYIGGAGVGRGYLDRGELTAERFVPDQYSGEAGVRMYRTGDVGRWREEGSIEFLGRNDFQVKVRGFRIELGEIEARLEEQAGVREAVVVVKQDESGEKRLVAYYTCAETNANIEDAGAGIGGEEAGAEVGAEQLREQLGDKLPAYMVPAAFVRLDKLPLTANGKLDRRALPEPEGDAYAVREYEAPVGEIEEAVAGIWADVLKVERIGRQDDFFALGGHSLLAVRVITRLRQALDVEIALAEIFARPVLADLADEVLTARLEQFDPNDLARILRLNS
jgi:acyl-coenzyme A synthetase/AMP-(fatty) acid ligase/acyl carrier protein